MGDWNTEAWGVDEWGGAPPGPPAPPSPPTIPAGLQAYFMPPTTVRTPPPPVPASHDSPRFRHMMQFRTGDGTNVTVAGVEYLGGRWNGPLTDAQVAALTAAGYASGIYYTGPDWEGLPA